MISYLNGKVILKKDKFVVLDVQGVGYKVFLSQKNLLNIPENSLDLKVWCFHNIRENIMDLYGFSDYKELEFFEILESIRGVGPKAALELSSLGPLEKIRERIIAQDESLFAGIPGIGKKKAMTIVLELSGKIKHVFKKEGVKEADEAESALVSLGFSRQNVKDALSKVSKNTKDQDQRIKEALKILGKNNL
jgi:Holliday junction DNA helicase RuvA